MCVVTSDKQKNEKKKTNPKQKQNAHIRCDIIECVRAATLRSPIVQLDYHHLHKNENKIYSFLSSDFIVACAVLRAQLCVHVFIIGAVIFYHSFWKCQIVVRSEIEKSSLSTCLCACSAHTEKLRQRLQPHAEAHKCFEMPSKSIQADERWLGDTRFTLRPASRWITRHHTIPSIKSNQWSWKTVPKYREIRLICDSPQPNVNK